MRRITHALAAMAAALTFLACPRPALSQGVSVSLLGQLSEPAVCDGVVYFSTFGGKLYAINASDGMAVPGFPLDISGAVGDGSFPYGRPGVYYGSLGKAIYVMTSLKGVVKVWPNGTVAWINKLDGADCV